MHAATSSADSMALNDDIGRGMGRGAGATSSSKNKRLVMIIEDPGRQSAAAMEWALSHSIVEGDDILLLHVDMPPSGAPDGAPPTSRSGSGGGSASSPLGVFLGGGTTSDGGDCQFI